MVPSAILLLWLGMAIFGPLLDLQPDHIELARILVPPGSEAWMGYDDLGRPLLDRLVAGARTSFLWRCGS